MVIKWNTEKLNKYMSRIDGAIMHGRYYLALKLANRLLKHYFRYFITYKMPYENEKDNIRLMSIVISRYLMRYFRKYKIPYSERRLLVMNIISNVIVIYMMNSSDSAEDMRVIDKATATYVRENVNSIVWFLGKYL